MIIVVLNGAIALLCFYVAWQMVRLRVALAKATQALTGAERATYRVLSRGPQAIGRGQQGTYQLRQTYRVLELRLQKVQQILSLLGLTQLVWQWYGRHSPLAAATLRQATGRSLSPGHPKP